jgi:hypothetical protein
MNLALHSASGESMKITATGSGYKRANSPLLAARRTRRRSQPEREPGGWLAGVNGGNERMPRRAWLDSLVKERRTNNGLASPLLEEQHQTSVANSLSRSNQIMKQIGN